MEPKAGATPVRWGRILSLLLALLVGAEVAARVGIAVWAGEPYRSLAPFVWSPFGLARNNPNLTSPHYKLNAQGFRNPNAFTKQKPADTFRVIVLGGSVMYSGLGGTVIEGTARVDSRSTVAQYLERELRADPALHGLDVEVINASVNFSRIVEVSTSYIAEYARWDADLVVIGGSGNNFGYLLPKEGGPTLHPFDYRRSHPWQAEFERQANDRSLLSWLERTILTAEHYLASVAVARKLTSGLIDRAFGAVQGAAARSGLLPTASGMPALDPADMTTYDRYIDGYLAYLDAIVAMAARRGQNVAVFWEYLLGNVGDLKPLSEDEQKLLVQNRWPTWRTDRIYDFRARDRVAEFCRSHGVAFVDPLPAMRHHQGTVYIDYLHYTREGNAFAARQIYEQTRELVHERADQRRGALSSTAK